MLNNLFFKTSFLFLGAYLLGSISFALIISRFKKTDLTKIGSGNLGATNVYRALGLKYAILVFFLDACKGYLPTLIAIKLINIPILNLGIGIGAILGHSLPIFNKFKGGKSVATSLGVLFAIAPKIFIILFPLGIIIIYFTKLVALATLIGCFLAPILLYLFHYPTEYILFITCISIFIIYRHKKNLIRLFQGKENKV
ncbi:glycerol-3-phosphate 1-O-acyltransferase PlsY [bacterium]|nr:glycerol-3-phosphate 1-O-acyltransferase PlsY [bacterium]MBT3581347.1 glycerol-3-phosphate 1-O-acyltransferase PlsY [bacterium]MBT4552080.1 glycerol-3-phosphate 1-O-acyltransferase PlsY [bacterium]MBT5989141.1 glycerol-3-phosphate 1-O-acyltransferase PlsY [bacterium]